MALKPVVNVKCPCCGSVLEVNVEQERVTAHRRGRHLKQDARGGEDSLDVAVRQHEESRAKLDQQFSKAHDKLRSQEQRLEDLFREASRKAREHEEEPEDPDNPFRGGKVWD